MATSEGARGREAVVERRGASSTEEAMVRRHEFVRDEERDLEVGRRCWETRLAARYYARLHKEYAIIDLSRWRDAVYGLRWRTEGEVVDGVGVDVCAAKRCSQRTDLRSWELPFRYEERGETKMELVKVRLCPACADKLSAATKKKKKRSSHRGGSAPSSAAHDHTSKRVKHHTSKTA